MVQARRGILFALICSSYSNSTIFLLDLRLEKQIKNALVQNNIIIIKLLEESWILQLF